MELSEEMEKNISELKYAIHGNFVAQAIAAACKLDLFDNFNSAHEAIGIEQLSTATQSNVYSLRKLLNFLVTAGLLTIHPDRKSYSITSKGELLKKDSSQSMHYFARLHATSLFRGASDFLFESIKNNKPGTSYFCDTDMFSYLKTNESDNDVFNKAMSNLTSMHADGIGEFIRHLKPATVLDAGGGVGTLLCAILKHNPQATGTIVDLPNVKEAALEYVSGLNLSHRVNFLSTSFFEEFQAEADVITIHHVLHDYSDEDCVIILKNCKRSLSRGGSILIVETILGDDAEIGVGWLKDLIMHVITPGGRVRKQEDFQRIVDQSGLRIQQIHRLTNFSSDISIIQLQLET